MKKLIGGLSFLAFSLCSFGQTGSVYPDQMLSAAIKGDEAGFMDAKSRAELAEKPARGDRKSARSLNSKGLSDISSGNFSSAVETLKKAIEADPLDSEIPSNLGYAYLKQGGYDQATAAVAKSLMLQPGRGSAWATLGESLARSGNVEAAIAAFNITFALSQNKDKTKEYFAKIVSENSNANLTQAAKVSLESEGIKPIPKQTKAPSPPQVLEQKNTNQVQKAVATVPASRVSGSSLNNPECPPFGSVVANSPNVMLQSTDKEIVSKDTKIEVDRLVGTYCAATNNWIGNFIRNGQYRSHFVCLFSSDEMALFDKYIGKPTPDDVVKKLGAAISQLPQRCESFVSNRYSGIYQVIAERDAKELAEKQRQIDVLAAKKAAEEKEKLEKAAARKRADDLERDTIAKAQQLISEKSGINQVSRVVWGAGLSRASGKGEADPQECFGRAVKNVYGVDGNSNSPMVDKLSRALDRYLDAPSLTDIRYVADKSAFLFNISSARCRFEIPASISSAKNDADRVRADIESLIPIVAFDLQGDSLVAKHVVYFSKKGQITSAPLNYKVDYVFSEKGARVAEKYLTNLEEKRRLEAEREEKQAEANMDAVQLTAKKFRDANATHYNGTCRVQSQQAFGLASQVQLPIDYRRQQLKQIMANAQSIGCNLF